MREDTGDGAVDPITGGAVAPNQCVCPRVTKQMSAGYSAVQRGCTRASPVPLTQLTTPDYDGDTIK